MFNNILCISINYLFYIFYNFIIYKMSKFNLSLENTVFLTGYDIIKKSPNFQKIQLPTIKDVSINALTGFGYEYIGSGITETLVNQKMLAPYAPTARLAGKVLGMPLIELVVRRWMMNGQMGYTNLVMKSLVAVGSQYAYRQITT